MSYRMHEITDRVRVGVTGNREANIEVWSGPWSSPDSNIEAEIHIPADAVQEVATWLLKNA